MNLKKCSRSSSKYKWLFEQNTCIQFFNKYDTQAGNQSTTYGTANCIHTVVIREDTRQHVRFTLHTLYRLQGRGG